MVAEVVAVVVAIHLLPRAGRQLVRVHGEERSRVVLPRFLSLRIELYLAGVATNSTIVRSKNAKNEKKRDGFIPAFFMLEVKEIIVSR